MHHKTGKAFREWLHNWTQIWLLWHSRNWNSNPNTSKCTKEILWIGPHPSPTAEISHQCPGPGDYIHCECVPADWWILHWFERETSETIIEEGWPGSQFQWFLPSVQPLLPIENYWVSSLSTAHCLYFNHGQYQTSLIYLKGWPLHRDSPPKNARWHTTCFW